MKFKLPPKYVTENIGALFIGMFVARVLSAFSVILISRRLGPDTFGQYAASLSIVRLSSIFFTLGLDSWLLRLGGREQQRVGDFGIASLVLKVVFGVIWLAFVMLLTQVLNPDTFSPVLLFLAALSVWFEEIARIGWSTFKAALQNKITLVLTVGTEALLVFVTIMLSMLNINNAELYLLGRTIVFLIAGIISTVLMMRTFRSRFYIADAVFALKDTPSFGVSVALATIYGQADVTIIAHWLGKTATGLYSPAISLASALFLIPAAIYSVMLPVLSQSDADSAIKTRHLSLSMVKWVILLAILLGGGLAIIAKPLVLLVYGQAYVVSGTILAVLSGVLAFRCINFGLGAVLAAVGWQGRRILVQLISAVLNVALNIAVVQSAGILGVAWVYVSSEIVLAAGYAVLIWQWMKRTPLVGSQVEL